MEKIKGEKIMTKYLNTKPGSLEEATIKILQEGPYDKDDMKHQPDVKKEATSQDVSPSLANKPIVTTKTALVAAPGGKEKVIRIPIEKLADYKAKGYVEAEEFVPEEKTVNPYAVGMAAAMKQTGDKPPLKKSTITKAHDIAKKIEKNEEVQSEELKGNQKKLDKNHNGKLDADDFRKLRKEDEDADKMNKKQKDVKGEKEVIKIAKYEEETIKEAGMKAIDTDNQELKRLRLRLTQLRDSEKAAAGDDTTNIEKQIHQTRSSILDIQKKQLQKQEDIDADKMNKKQKEVKGEKEPIKKIEEAAKKVDVKKDKKGSKNVNVQIEVESKKPNYKSYKKSLKKEEENPKNMKKTLTGQPVTKIDTEPKLAGHN
jgi:hypothetical protein